MSNPNRAEPTNADVLAAVRELAITADKQLHHVERLRIAIGEVRTELTILRNDVNLIRADVHKASADMDQLRSHVLATESRPAA